PRPTRVVVAGAGAAGAMIVQEMQRHPGLGLQPVGFVDDAPEKQALRIRGLPVLGRPARLGPSCRPAPAGQGAIAMPSAPGKAVRAIVGVCEEAGVRVKIIPGLDELLDSTIHITQTRDVQLEDLLRRTPVQTDLAAVAGLLRGRRVLITGGGGS